MDDLNEKTPCTRCSKVETLLGNKRCSCCNQWYCYDCYEEHQQQAYVNDKPYLEGNANASYLK